MQMGYDKNDWLYSIYGLDQTEKNLFNPGCDAQVATLTSKMLPFKSQEKLLEIFLIYQQLPLEWKMVNSYFPYKILFEEHRETRIERARTRRSDMNLPKRFPNFRNLDHA